MTNSNLPEHVRANRTYWDSMADDWVDAGERNWNAPEPYWGMWQIPESLVNMLPANMTGMNTIELGCGTGYVSGWMARRGAHVVGIDNSERQLTTARRLADKHGVDLKLHHGNAEKAPYPDEHFDFAISEYGAAIWCDPNVWIPEAHRILKPGGQLVFLGNTPWAMVCTPLNGAPCEPALHRNYFDLYQIDWREAEHDPGGMEFNMPISSWFKLFRDVGFDVIDYQELQAPKDSPDRYGTSGAWAYRWPSEQVWKVRRR